MSKLNQKELIHEKKWDILIVLDACRYDFFENDIRRFLEGDLEKVISPAQHTSPWCKRIFNSEDPINFFDCIYVSANPLINSEVEINNFNAKNCFHRVIDVWNWGWHEKHNTVLPSEVNKGVNQALDKYPSRKIIVHYLQPHAPYLCLVDITENMPLYFKNSKKKSNGIIKIIRDWIRWRIIDIFGMEFASDLGKKFDLSPLHPIDAALRKVGCKGVRAAYRKNLEIVLKKVTDLIDVIEKKDKLFDIVITSDHGELLGENGKWGHRRGLSHRKLKEVPWFEVHTSVK